MLLNHDSQDSQDSEICFVHWRCFPLKIVWQTSRQLMVEVEVSWVDDVYQQVITIITWAKEYQHYISCPLLDLQRLSAYRASCSLGSRSCRPGQKFRLDTNSVFIYSTAKPLHNCLPPSRHQITGARQKSKGVHTLKSSTYTVADLWPLKNVTTSQGHTCGPQKRVTG